MQKGFLGDLPSSDKNLFRTPHGQWIIQVTSFHCTLLCIHQQRISFPFIVLLSFHKSHLSIIILHFLPSLLLYCSLNQWSGEKKGCIQYWFGAYSRFAETWQRLINKTREILFLKFTGRSFYSLPAVPLLQTRRDKIFNWIVKVPGEHSPTLPANPTAATTEVKWTAVVHDHVLRCTMVETEENKHLSCLLNILSAIHNCLQQL